MKNFIVPIDFSEDSLKGLELALLFASRSHVNIQMVFVQQKTAEVYQGAIQEEKSAAEKKFQQLIDTYSPKLKLDSTLRYIVKKGSVYKEIVNQAHSFKDSIITASTHGSSGFEEFFIGSNAFKIMTLTDRPVIILRKGKVPRDFQRIVMPVDTTPETRQKVMLVSQIARLFKSEVHVVPLSRSKGNEISKRLDAYTRQMTKYLESAGVTYRIEPLFGDNEVEILVEYSNIIRADLLTIITDEASAFSGLFMTSKAHQVINKSVIPVLNIKPAKILIPREFRASDGW